MDDGGDPLSGGASTNDIRPKEMLPSEGIKAVLVGLKDSYYKIKQLWEEPFFQPLWQCDLFLLPTVAPLWALLS